MDTVIALFISIVGSCFCGIDFCSLFTFVSIALDLTKYAKDKTTQGR